VLTDSGNLALGGSSVQDFFLGTNASVVDVTSNLTLNSTINITAGNGFGPGAYPLFDYSGTLGGNPVLGSVPGGFNYSFYTNTAKTVTLLVTQAGLPPQYLYGVNSPDATGMATLYQVDPVTAATAALFRFPLSFPKIGQLTYFPDAGEFVLSTEYVENPILAFINPSTHLVTEVPISSLSTNNDSIQGLAYYPPADAFVVTYGTLGSTKQTSLALVDTNGRVIMSAAQFPFPDADNVVYNPALGQLELVDLNDTTGVQAVSNPFGSSPSYVMLGAELKDDFAGGSTVSPAGQMFDSEYTNDMLLTLTNGNFVPVAAFNGAMSATNPIMDLAFAPALPPQNFSASLSGAGLQLQGGGSLGASYVLLSATNLNPPVVWQPVATNPAGAGGNWTFTDTNVAAFPQRYYRVTSQ
jgi:hypothetical protein